MLVFGIEKENLLFTKNYKPLNLKYEDIGKGLDFDFSANQLELKSAPSHNISKILNELNDMFNQNEQINKNIIWPLSQPGFNNYKLKIAAKDKNLYNYKKKLLDKYPQEMMNLSGIHINVSDTLLSSKNDYFKLMKKIYIFLPIIIQFYAFTPIYQSGALDDDLQNIGKNKGYKNSITLRNSLYNGYSNEYLLNLNYQTLETYEKSLEENIKMQKIISSKELYSKVRLKQNPQTFSYYLELRFIDLNPFYRIGISFEQLILIKYIIKYLLETKIDITFKDNQYNLDNLDKVCTEGQNKNLSININNKIDSLYNHTLNFLQNVKKNISKYALLENDNLDMVESTFVNIINSYKNGTLEINKMINIINQKEMEVKDFGIKYQKIRKEFKEIFKEQNLELSTKILMKKAVDKGYSIKLLDEYANVISIADDNHQEIVVQATKTNLDHYADVLMMENKIMTKQILKANKIKIAKDLILQKDIVEDSQKVKNIYSQLNIKKIVIKPDDTNFGLGITVLNKNFLYQEFLKALKFAFKYSQRIIVEEFFEGIEYRFLVIDGKTESILQRIPANVVGDGEHTIEELVNIKNKNSYRGENYKTPVEIIKLGEIEKDYLRSQQLTELSILKANKVVYLRENSNISTGGDSNEVYELIPKYYHQIAEKVAKIMNIKICGIDMIINHDKNEYIIVENNFNPAIHIHEYPYYGIGKDITQKILNLLFKNNN